MKFIISIALLAVAYIYLLAPMANLSTYGACCSLIALSILAIHVVVSAKVFEDAKSRKEGLYIHINPWAWALIALIFGLLGLLLYWLVNDSPLAQKKS